MKTALVACLIALGATGSVTAAVPGDGTIISRYSIGPLPANAATELSASIDLPGCIAVEPVLRVFEVEAGSVRLGFEVLDYCDPALEARTQAYPLGTLAAGTYEVSYLRCFGNVLPGEEPCSLAGAETIDIRAATSSPSTVVPTLSGAALMLLIVLAGGFAGWRLRTL